MDSTDVRAWPDQQAAVVASGPSRTSSGHSTRSSFLPKPISIMTPKTWIVGRQREAAYLSQIALFESPAAGSFSGNRGILCTAFGRGASKHDLPPTEISHTSWESLDCLRATGNPTRLLRAFFTLEFMMPLTGSTVWHTINLLYCKGKWSTITPMHG